MKKLILVILCILLIAPAATSQTNNKKFTFIDIYDLFKGTTWADSLKIGTKVANYRLAYLVSDSSANSAADDSIFSSNSMIATSGNIQVVLKVDSVSYDFGTMAAVIEYGAFRGPNYSSDGYEWNTLLTCTQDTVFKVNITTKSWNQNEEYPHFKYRITETGQQSNNYSISHQMIGRK